jgi:tRNA-specific 2-thiouridylase
MSESKPIAVAMSGGVDSSTVAALLCERCVPVIGLTMQLWNQRRLPELSSEGAGGRCCSLEDVYDARHVAEHLGIPYYVVNLEEQFEKQVVKPFIDEYLAGRTPIPCTLCNNVIKFDRFIKLAASVGAERIATGHYARADRDPESGRYLLRKGADEARDQTYFLFGLKQEQLARTQFPLGEFTKTQVRQTARRMGLPVADKGDSQEICFVPNGDYAAFIEAYFREQGMALGERRGEIVSTDGRRLGEHSGVHRFTVGQRRGLKVAVGEPLYVIRTDAATQQVIVGRRDELLRAELTVAEVNWIAFPELRGPVRARVKIRNKHVAAPATVHPTPEAGRVGVHFDEPQRAVTPGQAAVFYDGDTVLGGGWIS